LSIEKSSENQFQLIFEGVDPSAAEQSISRIKAILVGDLNMSIEEVQGALEQCPITIKSDTNENNLSVHYNNLKSAGAKVLLLKPKSIEVPTLNLDTLEEQSQENAETEEIEFELDLDGPSEKLSVPKEAKTFELNLDESPDDVLAAVGAELGEELTFENITAGTDTHQIKPAFTTETQNKSKSDNSDFSLELMPAGESLDLIDSTNQQNDLDENGEWGLETLSTSLKNPEPVKTSLDAPLFEFDSKDTPAAKTEEIKKEEVTNQTDSLPNLSLEPVLESEIETPATTKQTTTETKSENTSSAKPAQAKIIEALKQPVPTENEGSTETVTPDKVQKTRKKSRKNNAAKHVKTSLGLPTDVLIPILIGGLILGGVNWLYFSSTNIPSESSIDVDILVNGNNETVSSSNNVNSIKALPKHIYAGESTTGDILGTLRITSDFEEYTKVNIQLRTPEPAALTPEEIVNQVAIRPWLKKIEIDNLKFSKIEANKLLGLGQAKLYIEKGQERNRVIGNASLELVSSNASKELSSKLTVSLNSEVNASEQTLLVLSTGPNEYQIALKLEAKLKQEQ
jgi:hypothetical protein